MARPLLERLALAHKPTSRIADCKRDLAEAEAERAAIDERIANCERRSEDPATPEDEARLAMQQSVDWRFHAKRLDRAIAEVRDAIAAKEADEAHVERRKQFEAAKAANAALIERWRALAPIWDDLVALFADTLENDKLIAQANQHRPRDEDVLRSAEIVARGALNESYWPNSIGHTGDQFQRLTSMAWPNFAKPGNAWSPLQAERRELAASMDREAARHAAAMEARAAANTPQALAAKARAEAARYSRYHVSDPKYSGAGRKPVRHKLGTAGIGFEDPVALEMDDAQVQAARKAGLKVEACNEPEPRSLRPRHELVR